MNIAFAIVLLQLMYTNNNVLDYNNTSHSVTLKPCRRKARTGPGAVLVLAQFSVFGELHFFLAGELLATTLDEHLSIQSYITAEITQYGSR